MGVYGMGLQVCVDEPKDLYGLFIMGHRDLPDSQNIKIGRLYLRIRSGPGARDRYDTVVETNLCGRTARRNGGASE